MRTRFLMLLAIVASVLMFATAARANLIWDVDYLAEGVQDGAGTWQDGGDANWWSETGNEAWSNASPAVAQFGTAVSTVNAKVNINSDLIKVLGFVNYGSGYELIPTPFYDPRQPEDPPDGDQTIELNGTNPEIVVFKTFWIDTHITTAAGVESVTLRGGDPTYGENLYFYNSNTFNAPIVVGSDPEVAKGITLMARIEGCLGGSSSDSITVMNGSTLRFGMPNDTIAKPIIVAGNSNAIEFYASSTTPMCTRELTGTVTLTGDTRIRIRELDPEDPNYIGPHSNIISGAISGDYVLSIRNSSSVDPGRISLTNGANQTKSLSIFSANSNTYSQVYVTLGAQYTATESVTVGLQSFLITNGANYINTPLISLDDATATLDASAAGLTVASGTTLRGIGTVTGNVTVGSGGTVAPGTSAGTLPFENNVSFSGGGNMTWELGALSEANPGADYALASIAGNLTLGGTSQLTLDFGLLAEENRPGYATPHVFWTSNHSWKIVDIGELGTTTGDFTTLVNYDFAAGDFDTRVEGNDVFLDYTAGSTPVPTIPGDTDGDDIVDADDAAVVAQNWGQNVGDGGFVAGDFNLDHVVNAADAAIQVANWGSHVAAESTAVPEPGTLVLLAAGLAVFVVWRRR